MIRQTDWSGVTTRNIRSRKWALIAAALLAAAADIVALVVTAVEGAAVKFIIPAALLLAADAVFILLVCLSNYRFKYTAVQWKAYVIVVAVLTAVAAIVNFALGELAMTAAAAVILILSHAVAIVVVALAARHASRLKRSLGAPGMIVALAVLLAVTALSAAFTIGSGYFGQGETAELRAAVYESDGDGGYVVTGAAEGRGDTLVIPERINGAEVTAISASVLADSTVSAIVVEGEEFIPFEGLGTLDAAVSAVRLMAHKNVLDLYKNELYYADLQNKRGLAAIANASVPTGLEENEVYITFSYDDEALELAGGKYLPTTVLDKGSRADISVIGAGIAYAERSDASSLADLKYNYDNNGRYILSAADELSSPVNESVCVEVSFERVFRVMLGEDNDSVYEDESGFGESVINGAAYGYTFTTASAANELAETFWEREGFDLVWDLGTRLGTSVTDISAALSTRYAESSVGTVTMSPVWTLHAPEVTLTPSEAGAAYTYGDKVEIASEVEPPFEGCDISYTWTDEEGETLGTAAVYTDLRPLPADSGTYTLSVSVSADSTSLTSSASASLKVTVAKKELGTVWSVPAEGGNVYKAADFLISVAADGADVVFDDGVTITSSLTSVRDAGKYTARATLDAESAEKYVFRAGAETATFEIKPLEITAEWGGVSFEYDGEQHAPSATVAGVGEDVIGAEIAGAKKNAGNYTARLTLTGEQAANYTVANASHAFEITPRGVTLVWDETELVYDGTAQHPTVTGVTDAVPGEEGAVVGSVSYGGAKVNAGNGYTATATLPSGGNYKIEAGAEKSFAIERRPLTLAGKDVRKTYDGEAYEFSAADLTVTGGLVSRDSLAEVVTGVTPSDAGATAKVAGGPYDFTLTVVADGEKAGNYTVTGAVSGSLTIDRRGITLVWDETELVYDGTAQHPTVTGVTGAVPGEEDAVVGSVRYGAGAGATDAGDYTVTATLPVGSNYEITAGAEKSFTIERRALTFEVRDIGKDYDGKAYEFTTADLVLKSGEPAGGAQISDIVTGVTPSGAGATATDAGSYPFTLTPVVAEAYAKNYSIVGDFNGTISIDKLSVTLVWSTDREFVYDGTAQRPEVTDIVGVLESEKDEVLASVIYGAGSDATHAGDYTVTATLPSGGNYEVTEGGGCEFTIAPRPVSVTWTGGTEFTEDGEPHAPEAECADAVAVVTTEYYERNGDGSRGRKLAGAPDEAGAYIAVAVIADADNFEISGELECAFDIAEAETGGGI